MGSDPGDRRLMRWNAAQQHIAAGYRWVVGLELEKFFDRVSHDKLMGKIAERVSDKSLLKLIRAFLRAGVMEGGLVSPVDERRKVVLFRPYPATLCWTSSTGSWSDGVTASRGMRTTVTSRCAADGRGNE
jgi:hypothetical protein